VDVWAWLVWGTRDALSFGITVTLLTGGTGLLAGALSAAAGGWINQAVMRIADAFLAFPIIAGVWLFQAILFPYDRFWGTFAPWQEWLLETGVSPTHLALIAFSWMPYARLINTSVLRLKDQGYAQAARALGGGPLYVLFRHLLPNAIAPVIVVAARDVGGMVLLAASLSFVGVGGGGLQRWTELLVQGKDYVLGISGNPLTFWWTYLPPSLALVLFGVGWNLLGDGLHRQLSPQRRRNPAVQAAAPRPARLAPVPTASGPD
jgi:peptide/nickel transport system permease protein